MYDEVNKISGINHFMLPESRRSGEISNSNQFYNDLYENPSLRYGSYSMELLINEMLKLGGQKKYMLAKVFGGGNVLKHNKKIKTVGENNINFILNFLTIENIEITSKSLGGNYGRKLYYTTKELINMKPI